MKPTSPRSASAGANAAKLARGESLATVKLYGEADGEDGAVVLAAFRDAGSYSGAAKLLNERGVKPRDSTRGWWPSSVAVVVKRMDPSVGRRRDKGVRAGGSDFVLARLLRCPTCGTMLTGTRDRERPRRVRYSCRLGTALPHLRITVSEHLILTACGSKWAGSDSVPMLYSWRPTTPSVVERWPPA